MNFIARPTRLAATAALTLPLLAGCSGSGDDGASSAAPESSTPASSSTPSSSTTSSSTTSSDASSTATSTSSATSGSTSSAVSGSASSTGSDKPSSSTSTTKRLDAKLVGSCVSASTKINGAIGQWNTAVRSGDSDQRASAARRLGSTAGELRTLASKSKHKQFSTRARGVAGDLDKMKKAHDSKKSVHSGDLNASYRGLRTWCTDQIKP